MSMQYTETVVAIAIGVLTAVFVGALFILVIICKRQRLYYKTNLCEKEDEISNRPDMLLIDPEKASLELNEVTLTPNLSQILADAQWLNDASGLVPSCIELLKTCHRVTERLTTVALGGGRDSRTEHPRLEATARTISMRVDDLVRGMCPPLDARVLEARAAVLIAAVEQLALLGRYEGGLEVPGIGIEIYEMEKHLTVLREAALTQEAAARIQNIVNNTSII